MKIKRHIFYFCFSLMVLVSCSKSDSMEGDQYFNKGQFEEAVAAYNEVLTNSPKNLNALYNRGRSYEELGKLDEAEKDFKSALALDEKNVQVLMGLSNIYQKKENHMMALQYANYATEVPGAPAMAYFLKGRAYHQLGNTQYALTAYNAAIKMNMDFAQAFYYRGILKLAIEQKSGACNDFESAIALDHREAKEAAAEYCQ